MQRVFNTVELVENILRFVSPSDLRAIERVSSGFRAVIASSPFRQKTATVQNSRDCYRIGTDTWCCRSLYSKLVVHPLVMVSYSLAKVQASRTLALAAAATSRTLLGRLCMRFQQEGAEERSRAEVPRRIPCHTRVGPSPVQSVLDGLLCMGARFVWSLKGGS